MDRSQERRQEKRQQSQVSSTSHLQMHHPLASLHLPAARSLTWMPLSTPRHRHGCGTMMMPQTAGQRHPFLPHALHLWVGSRHLARLGASYRLGASFLQHRPLESYCLLQLALHLLHHSLCASAQEGNRCVRRAPSKLFGLLGDSSHLARHLGQVWVSLHLALLLVLHRTGHPQKCLLLVQVGVRLVLSHLQATLLLVCRQQLASLCCTVVCLHVESSRPARQSRSHLLGLHHGLHLDLTSLLRRSNQQGSSRQCRHFNSSSNSGIKTQTCRTGRIQPNGSSNSSSNSHVTCSHRQGVGCQ